MVEWHFWEAVKPLLLRHPAAVGAARVLPAALQAFPDLTTTTALTVLSAAPTPGQALGLSHGDLHALARSCGRWGITLREVARLHRVLHQPRLRPPVSVEQAMGTVVLQQVIVCGSST